jgi:hypothetical protein
VALLALVNHVVKFDFQALLSFDRLQARINSTKSRRFIQVAANDSFRVADDTPRIPLRFPHPRFMPMVG